MNGKLIKQISVIAFVLIVLGIIIIPRMFSKKDNSAFEGSSRGAEIPVTVKIIQPTTFKNNLQVSGSVIGNEEVSLKTETSGKVIFIGFKEGSVVKKGDILLKLRDDDLQVQLQKAEIRKKLAEDKEYRQRMLLGKSGVSQEAYDTALNDLNAAKADTDYIKAQMEEHKIVAPFNGTIGLRYVSEGAYVTPSTEIATLQNINPVKIDFSVPQRYANFVSVGNQVVVRSSASGKQYQAKVYAVEPKIDPATRSLKARAICPNDKRELIPGSYVAVDLIMDEIKNAISVPTQSLALDITGESVYLYKKGVAVLKKVESGIRTEDEVQIVNGISPGDTVITSGIMQLRPRAKVKITSVDQNKN